jgi:hypothetical protein
MKNDQEDNFKEGFIHGIPVGMIIAYIIMLILTEIIY